MLSSNINSSFFKGIYKDVWRKSIPNGLTNAEVDFVIDVCDLKPGNEVLDLMCGYGRHAIELSRRGLHVLAIDNLIAYTQEIANKKEQENLNIEVVTSDITELNLSKQFDAIICMGNSFGFFNYQEAGKILENLMSYLRQNAKLIIHTEVLAEISVRTFEERHEFTTGDYDYILERQFFFHPSRIEQKHTITDKQGATEVLEGVDYIFSINEFETLFSHVGLKLMDVFSTPRKRKFRIGDQHAYLVAEKVIP
jgi:SAM-dependent methyltransferase